MVVSDKERREVATRLRNQLTYMRENGEYYKNDLDVVECGNSAYRNFSFCPNCGLEVEDA